MRSCITASILLVFFSGCTPTQIEQPSPFIPPATPIAELWPAPVAPLVSAPAEPVLYSQQINKVWAEKCVRIVDGDTVLVLNAKHEMTRICLASIDAPEPKQPFSDAARSACGELCPGKNCEIHETGKDRFGRVLAFVVVDGVNVNAELIRRGLAWHYRQFSKDSELQQLEDSARESKAGLWSESSPAPIPPWEFSQKK